MYSIHRCELSEDPHGAGRILPGRGVINVSTTAMPAQVADNVAAPALFGAPKSAFADSLSPGQLPTIGALYPAKTIDLCVPNDPICSETGMVNNAANFAASRL